MADSELIVRLRGENSDLKSKLKEVTDASKTSASGMGSAFKTALGGIASAIGVTFSVAAVVNFAKQSVQAFMESERAAVSLKNVISNLGGSDIQAAGLQTMVDSLEQMSGFDDADIAAALQDLMVQTGNSAKATQALKVAMDLSAASGESLATSGQKVFQVMSGMTRSMREFGMTTRDGATDMDYLRELGDKMAGSLGANLETLDGKARRLRTSWDNLRESFGQAIAPIVIPGLDKAISVLQNIGAAQQWDAYLRTLDDDGRRRMEGIGAMMGNEWVKNFLANLNGNPDLWDNAVFGQQPGAAPIVNPSIYKPDTSGITTAAKTAAATIKDAFKASWEPITLMGGNLPELTKYIGNLRSAGNIKQKVTVDVQMTVNGGSVTVKNTNAVAKKIASTVAPAVMQAITHASGWSPGGGGGWAMKEE
ncbi:MAG TPA: hypothetical protein PLO19_07295 [Candidatus Cryosericum sp.]|nr:hypothetical protein [Candidatus Cryosericum sp.]HPS70529.1 hypothetical protein [Candidatus Cryosericum sp.]